MRQEDVCPSIRGRKKKGRSVDDRGPNAFGGGIASRLLVDTLPGDAGACDMEKLDPGNIYSKLPPKEDSSGALHGVDRPGAHSPKGIDSL